MCAFYLRLFPFLFLLYVYVKSTINVLKSTNLFKNLSQLFCFNLVFHLYAYCVELFCFVLFCVLVYLIYFFLVINLMIRSVCLKKPNTAAAVVVAAAAAVEAAAPTGICH